MASRLFDNMDVSATEKVRNAYRVRPLTAPHEAIKLVPEPRDDKHDPLTWSTTRKALHLAAFCFIAFAQVACPNANKLAYVVQSKTYHVMPSQLSYGGSASLAGLVAGPIVLAPLSKAIGRSSLIFWTGVAQVGFQVWAANMTASSQYIPFVLSRLFSGLVGTLPGVLGTEFVMETFYLHQRGRVFALFEVFFIFGVIMAPTVGGFILAVNEWPFTLWWTVPVIGAACISVFLFLEETDYDRTTGACKRAPPDWIPNRLTTFFFGWSIVPTPRHQNAWQMFADAVKITVAPVSIIPGVFSMFVFSFAIIVSLLMSIFLQTPEDQGGYGFTPRRNAYFTFVSWIATLSAQLAAVLLGDRLPLFLARKFNKGVWKPEYRLANVAIPVILSPIGLGLVGASLQYHLHYMVLAVGNFFVLFSAAISTPICLNYVAECFTDKPMAVGVAFNFWREALSVAISFFVFQWQDKVGPGCVFGTAAFLVLVSGIALLATAHYGDRIRLFMTRKSVWAVKSEAGALIQVPQA